MNSPFCWEELVILPWDSIMSPADSPEEEQGWLQWQAEECIVLSRWSYVGLCILWPILKLIYKRPLKGQITDW